MTEDGTAAPGTKPEPAATVIAGPMVSHAQGANSLADRFKRLIGEKVSVERRMIAARLALDLGERATAGPEAARALADELRQVALGLLEG
jgi:hypothetical protein